MPCLSNENYLWTINHVTEHGDTDIFPYPLELAFFSEYKAEIAQHLAQQDLARLRPMSALEMLVPKGRYSFRVAHQLYPVDTLILTAAVVSIGERLEDARLPRDQSTAFSYRYSKAQNFSLFHADCRYHDWLRYQYGKLIFSEEYSYIVEADISEFYQRIYHHRLENCLNLATNGAYEARFIKEFIRDLRARQSFGLPVGGNAARLLAELLLNDIDRAIAAQGYEFTRYVDDFRIFIKPNQDPYAALAFLAEHLLTNEGLSLSPLKTRVRTRLDYLDGMTVLSGEDTNQADEAATERVFYELYGSEDPAELAAALRSEDLIVELEDELNEQTWDVGKIRIIIRCLKYVRSHEAVAFVRGNLRRMLPFIKDIVLLAEELIKGGEEGFQDWANEIIEVILEETAQSLPAIRAWLLELFSRGLVPITYEQFRRIADHSGTLDQRALFLIRMRLNDVSFFRQRKARVDELNPWLQPAFIFAARCMPRDEYRTWTGNLRGRLHFPLADLFCNWAASSHGREI